MAISSPATRKSLFLAAAVVVAAFVPCSAVVPPPYRNHTVGDAAGWHFHIQANTSIVNYTLWAEQQSFYLGDFLIFDSDENSTVIQTYNATTYKLCSLVQDYGNLSSQFGVDDTEDTGARGGIPVPLTVEGVNYYFSSAQDGFQCRNGMRFSINVLHGNGLAPPPPPPSPTVSPQLRNSTGNHGGHGGGRRWWSVGLGIIILWVF